MVELTLIHYLVYFLLLEMCLTTALVLTISISTTGNWVADVLALMVALPSTTVAELSLQHLQKPFKILPKPTW